MAWVLIIALGVALAGAAGCFVSRALCAGGSCPITSKRLLMLAMVAVFGVWLAVSGCSKAGTADEGGVDTDSDSPEEPQAKVAVSSTPALGEGVFGAELNSPEEFQARVIDPGTPALVDFHATWCPPCLALAPILAKLEREYAGKVAFFRVDTDRAEALARQHDIQALPTLHLYRGGQRVAPIVGLRPEAELRRELDKLLKVE